MGLAEDDEMMFWGNHMGFGGWGLLFNGVLWIGLIALGIWLLARLFPTGGGNRRDPERAERRETPLEILQRRYARGEITKEEYETVRHDLAS
jgi:putative membrane protein